MATAELTVLGAGVFGLSLAYEAARRGARVRVIDPAGVGAGASGGIVGALAPHVPEQWNDKKQFQLESLLMAEGFWAGVAEAGGGDPGYARTGRLQPIADAAALDLARARVAGAEAHWGNAARWDIVEAPEGWAPLSRTGLVIRDTLSAQLHPGRATTALALAVRALGGEVLTEGERQGAVVHATGWAGLEALTAAHRRMVGTGVKGQAALLRHAAGGAPQIFAEGVHIVAHDDGTVAVGSTTERDFTEPDTTDARLDAVIAAARSACPALAGAPIVGRWAGVRPRARSRAPILGPHPFEPGAYIANGGFKIGFGMAPKAGLLLADLILEGRDAIPAAFRPEASL